MDRIFIVEYLNILEMIKNNKPNQTLCLEDIVKEKPILTESEMNNFCTYEEIVNDALAMFDEKAKNIIQMHDSNSNIQNS